MSRNALPTPGRIDLSASMMCAYLDELGIEPQRLERGGIDSLHFDIMDGHFVPNLALACSSLAALRPLTRRPFTAHFMVDNPETTSTKPLPPGPIRLCSTLRHAAIRAGSHAPSRVPRRRHQPFDRNRDS